MEGDFDGDFGIFFVCLAGAKFGGMWKKKKRRSGCQASICMYDAMYVCEMWDEMCKMRAF